MTPASRSLIVPVVIAAAAAAGASSPLLLRRMDAFRITRVEVEGAVHLPPEAVLSAAGVGPQSNLFEDLSPWRDALLRHPMIAEAEIRRRPRSTLLVRISEREPIALVPVPELRPAAANGVLLPVDLTAAELDLPVLAISAEVGADGRIEDPATLGALEALDRIRSLDRRFANRISEIAPAERGGWRLTLRQPAGLVVLIGEQPDPDMLSELRLALADIEVRGETGAARAVDARYRDQVVVSFRNTGER